MGITIYSPKVDKGNSVKGLAFAERLSKMYNFHQYDTLRGVMANDGNKLKRDPCRCKEAMEQELIEELLFAAAEGDLKEVKRLAIKAQDTLYMADYDDRTALHLAASEGQRRVVKFILETVEDCEEEIRLARISPRDRWQRTPLDDALSGGHTRVVQMLQKAGAQRGFRGVGQSIQ